MEVKRNAFRDDWAVADLVATWAVLAGLDRVDRMRTGITGHCWGGRVSWLGACHNPKYKAAAMLYGSRINVGVGEGGQPPVELADRIPCPMIEIFGNDYENPPPADADDLDAALTKAGVAHEFHHSDGAGHEFQDSTNEERYREEASDDAWEKVLAFLNRQLQYPRDMGNTNGH